MLAETGLNFLAEVILLSHPPVWVRFLGNAGSPVSLLLYSSGNATVLLSYLEQIFFSHCINGRFFNFFFLFYLLMNKHK